MVRAAAERVSYEVNTVARAMITGRTDTIGVILPEIGNDFFIRILEGVSRRARDAGYDLLLVNTDEDADRERKAVSVMRGRRVDGILACPADPAGGNHLRSIVESDGNLVLLDRSMRDFEVTCVGIDNRAAGYRATRYLLDAGHHRIMLYSGLTRDQLDAARTVARDTPRAGETPTEGRAVGYFSALADAGIAVDRSMSLAAKAPSDRPTAVLTTDSPLTLQVLRRFKEIGLSVPDDISLLGFDDAAWIPVIDPPVTVIEQPAYDIGYRAAGLLIESIEGNREMSEAASVILPARLIERSSVAAPPKL